MKANIKASHNSYATSSTINGEHTPRRFTMSLLSLVGRTVVVTTTVVATLTVIGIAADKVIGITAGKKNKKEEPKAPPAADTPAAGTEASASSEAAPVDGGAPKAE
jgi:hypothetical protein